MVGTKKCASFSLLSSLQLHYQAFVIMTTRHFLFISFLIQGKSTRQAAKLAGFAACVTQQNIENMLASARFQTELAIHMAQAENRRGQLQQAINLCSEAISNVDIDFALRLKAADTLGKLNAQLARMPVSIPAHVLSGNSLNYLPEPEEIMPTPEQLAEEAEVEKAKQALRLQKQLNKAEKDQVLVAHTLPTLLELPPHTEYTPENYPRKHGLDLPLPEQKAA